MKIILMFDEMGAEVEEVLIEWIREKIADNSVENVTPLRYVQTMDVVRGQNHIERHKYLHSHLDELVADMIAHTKKGLKETSVMELIEWSYKQTENPTEQKGE